jgi:hypothetical protein
MFHVEQTGVHPETLLDAFDASASISSGGHIAPLE